MKMGLYDGTGALSAQAKVLATQKLILEQTSDAQGDFARTSDGAANQQRILAAQVSNAKVAIGQAFLPILEAVLPVLVNFATAIGNNTGEFVAFVAVIGTISGAIVLAKAALMLWKAASIITTAVNYALATSFTAVQISTGIGIIAVVAGVAAFAAYTAKMNAARKESDLLNKQTLITAGTISATGAAIGALGIIGPQLTNDQLKQAYADFEKAKDGANKFGGGVDLAAEKLKKMKDAIKEASAALVEDMTKALDDAKDALKTAQDAFSEFGGKVSTSLLEAFNFKDAKDAGKDTGAGFLVGLRDQVTNINKYGKDVETLLRMNLSEAALAEVLKAGNESGAAIAAELIKGGQSAIDETNALVASAQAMADRIGQLAATQFYSAGVSNAQQYLAGVEAAMAVANARLAGKGLKLADVKGISAGFNDAISPPVASPISRPGTNFGGPGGGGQFVINVNGGLASSADIGKAVVNSIRAFNLTNGPANIQVA
jgi:hypothetical protein